MATPKRWSRTVGTQRGNRIRVYEREPGGKLYAAVWDPERHKYTQTGLGHRDRERALREVGAVVRLRESGDDLSGPLKLGTMVARYLAESIHTRDGSLKTAQYMKGCAQFATYLADRGIRPGLPHALLEGRGRQFQVAVRRRVAGVGAEIRAVRFPIGQQREAPLQRHHRGRCEEGQHVLNGVVGRRDG